MSISADSRADETILAGEVAKYVGEVLTPVATRLDSRLDALANTIRIEAAATRHRQDQADVSAAERLATVEVRVMLQLADVSTLLAEYATLADKRLADLQLDLQRDLAAISARTIPGLLSRAWRWLTSPFRRESPR